MTYDPSKPYKSDISRLISRTWTNPHIKVSGGVYPVIKKKFSGFEVDHTDGIGTKGFYHWQQSTFKAAVTDALAMNLNDLALVRAVPYKLSDHITVPVEDERVLNIVKELAAQCRKHRIAIVGGENSFHDNLEGLDISMTVSGIVKSIQPNQLVAGGTLIGLPSSGLHSNGFSVVRKVFKDAQRPEFTEPTEIYLDRILALDSKVNILGMMHITGGAFTKLKDLLAAADAIVDEPLEPQPIFQELYARGIKDRDMYKTFNCGTGFVLAVQPADADLACKLTKGRVIGSVVKGSGKVKITSRFSGKSIRY